MWNYEKRLQYPVKITKTNPKIAQIILTQYGGPDGELGASMRYLSQRYTMPYKEVTGILTDIGTEELAHLEMICAIVHQLTRDLTPEQLKESGFDQYYVDHTLALWPQAASGTPWSATTFQSKGDPITDLHEDLAAEQKARTTYDNILRLVKDPEVCDPIRFLREREIVAVPALPGRKHGPETWRDVSQFSTGIFKLAAKYRFAGPYSRCSGCKCIKTGCLLSF